MKLAFITFSFISLAISTNTYAAGNLLVTPTRVVFEGRDRSAQVTLVNQGSESSRFRISFIRQNMTEDGQFIPVKENEPGNYSDSMVRYSPRQITLAPGQSQVVRLILRKPRELEDGEYRSHMLFQSLPKASSNSVENIANNQKGISVEIIPIVGVSIPVIIRHGNLNKEITLDEIEFIKPESENDKPSLSILMNRTGNSSVYGDFKAEFLPKDGEPVVIGQAIGVSVYTPNKSRRFKLPLQVEPGFTLNNGVLHITFTESGGSSDGNVIAEVRKQY